MVSKARQADEIEKMPSDVLPLLGLEPCDVEAELDERAKACPFCGEMPEVELGLTARIACMGSAALSYRSFADARRALAFWNMRRRHS